MEDNDDYNGYYPWDGDFTVCSPTGCIAVVLLQIDNYTPPDCVAIYGPLRTENIGIEKIIANEFPEREIQSIGTHYKSFSGKIYGILERDIKLLKFLLRGKVWI